MRPREVCVQIKKSLQCHLYRFIPEQKYFYHFVLNSSCTSKTVDTDCEDLLLLCDGKCINDEEFLMLYNVNNSENLDILYQKYGRFGLDDYEDDECLANLRFHKNDLYELADPLMLPPNGFMCSDGTKAFAIEAFCLFLHMHCYPYRYMLM